MSEQIEEILKEAGYRPVIRHSEQRPAAWRCFLPETKGRPAAVTSVKKDLLKKGYYSFSMLSSADKQVGEAPNWAFMRIVPFKELATLFESAIQEMVVSREYIQAEKGTVKAVAALSDMQASWTETLEALADPDVCLLESDFIAKLCVFRRNLHAKVITQRYPDAVPMGLVEIHELIWLLGACQRPIDSDIH